MGFVDAFFATHHDHMRSHTDGGTSFKRVFFMNMSRKQRMNTGSSTEAEVLVGVADYAPNTIWLSNFLKVQGYNMTSNTLFQDNKLCCASALAGGVRRVHSNSMLLRALLVDQPLSVTFTLLTLTIDLFVVDPRLVHSISNPHSVSNL